MKPFLCLTINTSPSVSPIDMDIIAFIDISTEPQAGEHLDMDEILSGYLTTFLEELPYVKGYCGEFRTGIMQQAGPRRIPGLSIFFYCYLFSSIVSGTPWEFQVDNERRRETIDRRRDALDREAAVYRLDDATRERTR